MKVEKSWILLGKYNEFLWWGKLHKETSGEPSSVNFNHKYVLRREEKKGDLLGWCHTHPYSVAEPSDRDHATMRAWQISFGKPLLCCIKGTDGLRAYWYYDDESEPVECAVKQFKNIIFGVNNVKKQIPS